LSQNKPILKLDWCSYEAAKYAVEHWHYSKSLPSGKLIKIGVWENSAFIGAVIYSRGANNHLLSPYGLEQTDGCELARVALSRHLTAVTKIISVSLKMLKKANAGLKLVVSFADSRQGHEGKIYQAGNWVYAGSVKSSPDFYVNGRWQHQRNMHSLYGTIKGLKVPRRDGGYRHRYLMPLDRSLDVSKFKKDRSEMQKCVSSVKSSTVDFPVDKRRGSTDLDAPFTGN
jgi:hypothetical protein